MRVHSWDVRVLEGLGERDEPALRYPLIGVFTPEYRASIARLKVNNDGRSLRDVNLTDHRAIDSANVLRQREDHILLGPGVSVSGMSLRRLQ